MNRDILDEYVTDRSVDYAEQRIGIDVQIGPIVQPPVPRDKVDSVVDDTQPAVRSHLYDLSDLALAINHVGDPTLDQGVYDDDISYTVADDTLAELKIVQGILVESFGREVEHLADRLGVDGDDLVIAIRDELGYEISVSIEEEWTDLEEE